jgi:predicted transglutaminase-like cysteine proteinase
MKRAATGSSVLAISLLVFACMPATASSKQAGLAAREYGATLPPVGFVDFCQRVPENC